MDSRAIILAIETATSACSVALNFDGAVFERQEEGASIHSQVLLEMIQSVLSEAKLTVKDLDSVAVSRGPGSFTGLRIGIGVAQGIAYGANCPMIGVSSLKTLANQATEEGLIIAGIDARMNEIYWGVFEKTTDSLKQIGDAQVSAPETIQLPIANKESDAKHVYLVGNAWEEYKQSLLIDLIIGTKRLEQVIVPNAMSVLQLAQTAYAGEEWVSPLAFMPEYIRDNVAEKSSKN